MAEDDRKPGGVTTAPMSKGVMKFFSKLNVVLYKLSAGHIMGKMDGTPVCLVKMKGAKSGKTRTIPLMYNPSGDDVVLVASMGGAPKHPVWYHNLVAYPDVEIQLGGKKGAYRVHQADDDEKEGLWPDLVDNFPSFAVYRERTDRNIPVMVCSPLT